MVLAGHQPEYLPYIGFFFKMTQCDLFAIVDHIQFEKKSFQNRNYIRSNTGKLLLTVPVLTKGRFFQRICDVEIENTLPWGRKHWRSLYLNYRNAPFFKNYSDFFEHLYSKSWQRLVDLNMEIITYLMKCLNIEKKLIFTSQYNITGGKTAMLIDMCKKLGADTYVSGWGGKGYVDLSEFKKNGLHHRFIKLEHPVYPQQSEPFIPNLSAVDLLFNCGPNSRKILDEAAKKSIIEIM